MKIVDNDLRITAEVRLRLMTHKVTVTNADIADRGTLFL